MYLPRLKETILIQASTLLEICPLNLFSSFTRKNKDEDATLKYFKTDKNRTYEDEGSTSSHFHTKKKESFHRNPFSL